MQFCGRWKTIARSYTYVGLHEQLQWVFATQTGFLPKNECAKMLHVVSYLKFAAKNDNFTIKNRKEFLIDFPAIYLLKLKML